MRKLFQSKKMLSIIAGVLATIGVIGAGTYAWFTSSASTGEATFTTASVNLVANPGSYTVYEFFNGHNENLTQQKYLEGLYNTATQDNDFLAWLRNSNPTTWQVGMDQAGYNDYLATRADLEAQLPGLQAALREAWREYRIAAAIVNALVSGMDAAIAAIPVPQEPVEPLWSDYGWSKIGDYIVDMLAYEAELWAYNNVLLPAYDCAIEALMEGKDLAEDVKANYRAARDAARDARNAVQDALDALMSAIFNNVVVNTADATKVTPGSIIYGEFSFENESTIDTYFRIANGNGTDNSLVKAAVVRYMDATIALTDGGDGYLYCPMKLAAGEDIKIVVGAYVFGQANQDTAMVQDFGFGDVTVELIQASNNAPNIEWTTADLPNPAQFFQN